jgi:hypothetical protein
MAYNPPLSPFAKGDEGGLSNGKIPNSKHQSPNKFQSPIIKNSMVLEKGG